MGKISFNNKNNTFYTSLKASVDQYFDGLQIQKTGNWKLYLKSGILIPAALLIYSILLTVTMPAWTGMLLAAVLGFVLASIGFNVMHDACHGSYSRKGWVNDLMGLSLNALGGNAFIWKFKHNIIHHTYTNLDGVDDDIAKSPIMRQCSSQKWFPAHRFQHIYIVLVYAISSFAWVSMMDFNKYFKGSIQRMPLQKMDRREHIVFWASKVLYALFYVVLPIAIVGWKPWLLGFVCMHVTLGLTLALIFQLAHVVEHTEFVVVPNGDSMKIEEEWAIHQVKTTANFAPQNKIISWFVGGLNYQVEHHLFPRISHIHYPAISKIVKQTCGKFGIVYHEFPTMTQAIASHFRIMKELGRRPVQTVTV